MCLTTHWNECGRVAAVLFLVTALVAPACSAQDKDTRKPTQKHYRGLLGPDSKKVKHDANKTLLWAGPAQTKPSSSDAQWYDFTGADIPAAELQFGIGKDRIRAIDDPLFVPPDDPRLLELGDSPYRKEEKPKNINELRVIGYAVGKDARAYPVALLDGHELVNDRIGGKPVTVGW